MKLFFLRVLFPRGVNCLDVVLLNSFGVYFRNRTSKLPLLVCLYNPILCLSIACPFVFFCPIFQGITPFHHLVTLRANNFQFNLLFFGIRKCVKEIRMPSCESQFPRIINYCSTFPGNQSCPKKSFLAGMLKKCQLLKV